MSKQLLCYEMEIKLCHYVMKKIDFLPKPASNLPNVINISASALIFSPIWNDTLCEGNNDCPNIVNFQIDKAKPEHFKSLQNEDIVFIQNFNLESWNVFSTIQHRDSGFWSLICDFLERGRVLWFQPLFREFTLCYKIRIRLLG